MWCECAVVRVRDRRAQWPTPSCRWARLVTAEEPRCGSAASSIARRRSGGGGCSKTTYLLFSFRCLVVWLAF